MHLELEHYIGTNAALYSTDFRYLWTVVTAASPMHDISHH